MLIAPLLQLWLHLAYDLLNRNQKTFLYALVFRVGLVGLDVLLQKVTTGEMLEARVLGDPLAHSDLAGAGQPKDDCAQESESLCLCKGWVSQAGNLDSGLGEALGTSFLLPLPLTSSAHGRTPKLRISVVLSILSCLISSPPKDLTFPAGEIRFLSLEPGTNNIFGPVPHLISWRGWVRIHLGLCLFFLYHLSLTVMVPPHTSVLGPRAPA